MYLILISLLSLFFLECVCYSLFEDRVPYRDRQQAVNIVGNRASLDKQEHSDRRCHTHAQPRQGMTGNLQAQRGEIPRM